MSQSIFIAATGQHVGKTTLCLGILAGLQKRFSSVGFMKPVGQQHVPIHSGINVDKDVVLFKEYFHLSTPYEEMSPVILPKGFTRSYLQGKINNEPLQEKLVSSFAKISSSNEYTVVEGTGHVGVGSIVGLNNAQVAKSLGLDMVIIASAGLGSAYDQLALNIAMCHQYGVRVRGVILNRVLPDKRKMILDHFPRALKQWNIPLLGCVPFNEFLNTPTIKDFEGLFKTTLLSGKEHRMRHFSQLRLVAGSLEIYEQELHSNELIITPASRDDIIRRVLHYQQNNYKEDMEEFKGGIIMTGRYPPSEETLLAIKKGTVPVLYAPMCSYDAMKKITSFIAKIRIEDTSKIEKAIQVVEEHINFDLLTETQPIQVP